MQSRAPSWIGRPQLPHFNAAIVHHVAPALRGLARRGRDEYTPRPLSRDDNEPYVIAGPAMEAVVRIVDRVKDSTVAVMVLGESGTGKEVVARMLHSRSKRSERPYVAINCASIPTELAESELFGHAKAAFTGAAARRAGSFERADGGTLFLDEVGELDPGIQAKLLRVLEDGVVTLVGGETRSVDTRVVVATNRNLPDDVATGRFRADLYHRLNVITIRVPPLRERRGEIPALAEHLLDRFIATSGGPDRRFADDALRALAQGDWPGNVRSLRNVVQRTLLLAPAEQIRAGDIEWHGASAMAIETPAAGIRVPSAAAYDDAETEPVPPVDAELEALRQSRRAEREAIERALQEAGGNVTEAARILGVGRSTFYRRVKRLGIDL